MTMALKNKNTENQKDIQNKRFRWEFLKEKLLKYLTIFTFLNVILAGLYFFYYKNIKNLYSENEKIFSSIIGEHYFFFLCLICLFLHIISYLKNNLINLDDLNIKLNFFFSKYINNEDFNNWLSKTIMNLPKKLFLPFILVPTFLYFPEHLTLDTIGENDVYWILLAGGLSAGLFYKDHLKEEKIKAAEELKEKIREKKAAYWHASFEKIMHKDNINWFHDSFRKRHRDFLNKSGDYCSDAWPALVPREALPPITLIHMSNTEKYNITQVIKNTKLLHNCNINIAPEYQDFLYAKDRPGGLLDVWLYNKNGIILYPYNDKLAACWTSQGWQLYEYNRSWKFTSVVSPDYIDLIDFYKMLSLVKSKNVPDLTLEQKKMLFSVNSLLESYVHEDPDYSLYILHAIDGKFKKGYDIANNWKHLPKNTEWDDIAYYRGVRTAVIDACEHPDEVSKVVDVTYKILSKVNELQ